VADELGSIPWWVWIRGGDGRRVKVTAVTRQQAIQLGANGFGVSFEKVDYEVVR
jgi:hypothetical protein